MKTQTYHTQILLVNKLDKCKGKRNAYSNSHIKEIQDIYWNKYQEAEILKTINKGKW